jgi:hypothetical protein
VLAPIVLFAYKRPDHVRRTLQALESNALAGDSELFIFADGPKENADHATLDRIGQVREVIRQPWKFGAVHLREKNTNNGLANHVIHGVSELVGRYGKVIVLEDDLVTANGFLTYMNAALAAYAHEPQVMQISGYQFPLTFPSRTPCTFFLPFSTSWGWGTWKRAWDCFDPQATGWEVLKSDAAMRRRFDLDGSQGFYGMLRAQMELGSIDAWDIRWWWSVFRRGGLVLYCQRSLVRNIGFDEFATHTTTGNRFVHTQLVLQDRFDMPAVAEIDTDAYAIVRRWLATPEPSGRPLNRIRDWLARRLRPS